MVSDLLVGLFGGSIVQAGLLNALYSLPANPLRVRGGYAADRIGAEKPTRTAFVIVVAVGAQLESSAG